MLAELKRLLTKNKEALRPGTAAELIAANAAALQERMRLPLNHQWKPRLVECQECGSWICECEEPVNVVRMRRAK